MSRSFLISIGVFLLSRTSNIFFSSLPSESSFFVSGSFGQADEAPYLSSFGTLIADSYSAPLPAAMTSGTCLSKTAVINTEITLTSSMPASQVQNFCGTDNICVVPTGVTITMDASLVVGALAIRGGSLVWSDSTQSSSDQWLCAGYVAANGGSISIIVQQKNAYIYIRNNGAKDTTLRTRGFGGYGGSTVIVTGRSLVRTWSLLSQPSIIGSQSITLMHNPTDMGWRIGDRIAIAPTTTGSTGNAERYYIKSFSSTGNTINLAVDPTSLALATTGQTFASLPKYIPYAWTAQMSAEVINLSRNVLITGADFQHVPCTTSTTIPLTDECICDTAMPRTQCTMGTHVAHLGTGGTMQVSYTRIEKCGQRGLMGKYCLHFHLGSSCPTCLAVGNALEYGQQRGLVIHGTHLITAQDNVLHDIRGANMYIEDGNEMYNRVLYNVAVCPWALNGPKSGCTIPGTDNGQADTGLNQSGLWALSFTNYVIGNRAVNHFNGMLYQSQGFPNGRGAVDGKLCPDNQAILHMEGNTFHGHGRFGTYLLVSIFPKNTDRVLATNGVITDRTTCNAFDASGNDRGLPQQVRYNVDYDNVFVGQYSLGDVQHAYHTSIHNNELMYWKETKNFADGCSSHVYNGYYAGNLASGFALPGGHGTVLLENVIFEEKVSFESSHHCNSGVTGVLCMPTYLFINPTWNAIEGQWFQWGNNNGAMFVLGPDDQTNPNGIMFPAGYCSLANPYWTYLLSLDGGKSCQTASAVATALGADVTTWTTRYNSGILCTRPLRRLEIYTLGQSSASAPNIKLELWQNNAKVSEQIINYFQIGQDSSNTRKQGYSATVVPGVDHEYHLSLQNGGPIPLEWVIEFSDPVFGNRWSADQIKLVVTGRTCPSVTTSQHDRKYIWGDSNGNWLTQYTVGQVGRGACSPNADELAINCKSKALLDQTEKTCHTPCAAACNANSFCDCGSGTCMCNAGFTGPNCATDLCAAAGCGVNGRCAAKYLGGTLAVTDGACVCKSGTFGSKCDANPCAGVACSNHGQCQITSATAATCVCSAGWNGYNCETACAGSSCQPPCLLGFKYYKDTDIGATDITSSPASSKEACGVLCTQNAKCNSFTYNGNCYLKGSPSQTLRTQSGAWGGIACPQQTPYSGSGTPPVGPTTTQLPTTSPSVTPTVPATIPASSGPCTNGCSMQQNTDLYGGDLSNSQQPSADACCADCKATKGCVAWTLSGAACYKKSSIGKASSNVGLISGTLCGSPTTQAPTCTDCTKPEVDIDYFGYDIGVKFIGTYAPASDCCAACKSKVGCNAFTYYRGACYLKKTSAGRVARTGAISNTLCTAPTVANYEDPSQVYDTTVPPCGSGAFCMGNDGFGSLAQCTFTDPATGYYFISIDNTTSPFPNAPVGYCSCTGDSVMAGSGLCTCGKCSPPPTTSPNGNCTLSKKANPSQGICCDKYVCPLPTSPPPTSGPVISTASSKKPLGIIIGASVGGVVLIIVAVVLFVIWKKQRASSVFVGGQTHFKKDVQMFSKE